MPEEQYINISDIPQKVGAKAAKFLIPQAEIVRYFSGVRSKNEVIDGFLRFGGASFANLAVFSTFSKAIQFLKGKGRNIKEFPALGAINVDANTVVRRVIVSKYPYRGVIPLGSEEKIVFGKFFNCYAEEVFIYPGNISAMDTELLFYADTFMESRESSLLTFEYVVEKAVLALKLLWVQKKLAAI